MRRVALPFAAALLLCSPGPLAGQLNYFGQNKIQYRDFEWQVLPGEHIDLYYYPEEDQLARLSLVYAEESFRVLEQKFGHTPSRRIPLILYATHTDFEQTNVLPFVPPEGILGVTEFLKQRVTLPFQGNYAEFRHTIRHELVHAFQLSMAMESYLRIPRGARPALPLWWTEGLAELWSGGEDTRDEMILRELTISGLLPSIEQLTYIVSSGIVYPLGGALHRWLADEFGDWRVQVFYRDLWKYPTFRDALEATYGMSMAELNERYQYAFRQRYFPAVQRREPMGLTARQLAALAIKPTAYREPEDTVTHLLYVSPRDGYVSIYGMRLDRPGSGHILVKGERSAEFESFHPFASRIDVRDGRAVFSSKYLERDALFFWDLKRGKVVGRYQFPGLVSILSPTWAPDGRSVVFSGLTVSGISDLYRVRLPEGTVEPLTHDRYQDVDPTFSPDGRWIAFSSDRTPFGADGALNLFLLDTASGEIRYLTYGDWHDETPRWADNDRVYFSSDRGGVSDIYSVDTLGNGRQETATLSGAFDPEWIEPEHTLVYSGFHELSFGIFRSRTAEAPAGTATFALAEHRQPPGWAWPELSDSRYARADPTPYRRRFSLDFAAGDAIVAPGVGAATGALFLFSDFLTDHLLFLSVTSFQQSGFGNLFDNFSGSVFYLNQKRRLNWGAGAFRFRGLFYEGDFETIYDETSFGGFAEVRWPFSRFSRVEGQFRLERSDRFDLVGGDREEPRRVGWLASNYVSLVRDNSLWLPTGPIDGERRNLTLGVTSDLSSGRFDSWLGALDERRYFRLGTQSTYAVRLYGYYSAGNRPRRVSIGGSWGLRGYPRIGGVTGTRAVLLNQEIRFPLSNFLAIGFPFGEIRFPGIQGALFGDLGGAWTEETTDRGLLGSAGFGLRMPVFFPLVLRLDIGWRFSLGGFTSYALPSLERDRGFVDFFFGFNY
jgi:hypothetical protein